MTDGEFEKLQRKVAVLETVTMAVLGRLLERSGFGAEDYQAIRRRVLEKHFPVTPESSEAQRDASYDAQALLISFGSTRRSLTVSMKPKLKP